MVALQDHALDRVPVAIESPVTSQGGYVYKRILVPLSNAGPVSAIPLYAESLAARLGCEILLLQLVSVAPSSRVLMATMEMGNPLDVGVLELFDKAIQDEVAYTERYLERLSQNLRSRGFRMRWEVRLSFPATEAAEIVSCAKREEVDLVLLPSPKRSRFIRLLFPPTAEKVVQQLGVPVILVNVDQ